jgi:2-polyprenyl-6-hydroxyphenyl methylase/3-demethylubiquinone-9 3-methyltransferase
MQATTDEVYKQINNALYNEQGNTWWDENRCLHLLKSSVNPALVGYFRRLLDQVLKWDYRGAEALDVGCGGGILAEDFAAMGFKVTGIDPSEPWLKTARQHAQSKGLAERILPSCRNRKAIEWLGRERRQTALSNFGSGAADVVFHQANP